MMLQRQMLLRIQDFASFPRILNLYEEFCVMIHPALYLTYNFSEYKGTYQLLINWLNLAVMGIEVSALGAHLVKMVIE